MWMPTYSRMVTKTVIKKKTMTWTTNFNDWNVNEDNGSWHQWDRRWNILVDCVPKEMKPE